MSRLLVATDSFPPRWDGIGRFLDEIIPRLNDFQTTVISPDYGTYEVNNAKHIKVPLTGYEFGDYTVPRPRGELLKDEVGRADLVFGQTIGPIGSAAGYYARRTNTPLIHYTHSIEWQLVPKATETHALKRVMQAGVRWYAKWYYNQADKLLTPSREIQESLHYEGITTNTSIIPLGVNHDVFKPVEHLEDDEHEDIVSLKQELADDNALLGYHGRLAREKNLVTLLRAVKRLRRKRQDFRVLLVGDGLDDIREKFEKDPLCTTLQAKSDVHRYVQAFDIYVSTSLTETTSLSTAEAMACGKPVIATPAGYIQDYVSHGTNGLIFDFEDHYTLSRHIERLLDDATLREQLGNRAHGTAQDIFRWKRTANDISDALKDYE